MRNILHISKPQIESVSDDAITLVKVVIEEQGMESKQLWYKVPRHFSIYITTEVSDAFVVAFLLYAMKRGLDIKCESPVSGRLLVMLNKYLIPFISQINKEMILIEIMANSYDGRFEGQHCGTGISCGVDSLSTVIQHGLEENENGYKIDTLTLLNTGYYGYGEASSKQYSTYIGRSELFCKDFGFHFMTVDSNVSTITDYNFLSAHTYLTCSTLLLFQKYFRVYYYASGYPVFDFKPTFKDSAFYDIYLLHCISTESLTFISSCCTLTRVNKTKIIVNHPEVFRRLYVCFSGNSACNCSQCEKCVRTMLALDALGMREKIGEAFNPKLYEKYRIRYFSYMLRHYRNNDYYKEIYNTMQLNNIPIPILAYLNIFPCKFEIINFKVRVIELANKNIVGRVLVNQIKRMGWLLSLIR